MSQPTQNVSIGPVEIAEARVNVMGHLANEVLRIAFTFCKKARLDHGDIHRVLAGATALAAIKNARMQPESAEEIATEVLSTIYQTMKSNGMKLDNIKIDPTNA